MRNHCYENEFDLHENEPVGGTHFHMNCFALRLVLIQKQKAIRKWPIEILVTFFVYHSTLFTRTSEVSITLLRGCKVFREQTMTTLAGFH